MKELLRRYLSRGLAALLRANSRPLPLTPDRVMVVAPHADDETLGCGGLLATRSRRGWPVTVVFLTDSAGPARSTDSARRRRSEALEALGELGVPTGTAHFLDAPDGQLSLSNSEACLRAIDGLAGLIRQFRPAAVFAPYLGGGSSEHDAAHRMVRKALSAAGTPAAIWEYPIWAWWNRLRLRRQLLRVGENFHLELGPMRDLKLRALSRHRSQLAGLPAVLIERCTGPIEFYFHR